MIQLMHLIDHPSLQTGAGGIIAALSVLGVLTGLIITWR